MRTKPQKYGDDGVICDTHRRQDHQPDIRGYAELCIDASQSDVEQEFRAAKPEKTQADDPDRQEHPGDDIGQSAAHQAEQGVIGQTLRLQTDLFLAAISVLLHHLAPDVLAMQHAGRFTGIWPSEIR